MANSMLYDFETALKTLINAQMDVMELVTKWSELAAPEPRDVTFRLKGADGVPFEMTVPNIQKVIETIDTRTLPQDAKFKTVTAYGESGNGIMTNGGIQFAGAGAEGQYTALGTEGAVYNISSNETISAWPVYRYWRVMNGAHPSIILRPTLTRPDGAPENRGVMHAGDFFVYVPGDSTLDIVFASYGAPQQMRLAPSGLSVWHVSVWAEYVTGGINVTGRAVLMEA